MYDKLLQLLVWSVVKPDRAMILGGTWRVPVKMKLLDSGFVEDIKSDATVSEAIFQREYESHWTGNTENAFFSSEIFDRNRILNAAEYEYSGRSNKNAYYIISVDVGRKGDNTVISVIKSTPQVEGPDIKNLVNIYSFTDMHFEDQAILIKKTYYKYKARRVVLDGNGAGIGLVDYMVKPQTDPDTDEIIPDFGLYNDEDGYYKKYRTNMCETDALFVIKANAPINTEAHTTLQAQMKSGKIKFLVNEKIAQNKLMGTKIGQEMSSEQRAEYLKPYYLTSILKEEINNLKEETEGVNIILKQTNKRIKKDKFSSLEYGIYYIHQYEEDGKRKKKKRDMSKYMFMN